jgi:hypothetical protein
MTNQMSIPFGYFLHLLVQGHHGSLTVSLSLGPLKIVSVAEEVEGVGHNGSRRYHKS